MRQYNDMNVDWFDLAHQEPADMSAERNTMAKAKDTKQEPMGRAGDYLETGEDFEGCIGVEAIEGKELVLLAFEFFDTQWGDAMRILAKVGDETVVILSWSKVLIKQAHRLEEHLPLLTEIVRVKKYWKFT